MSTIPTLRGGFQNHKISTDKIKMQEEKMRLGQSGRKRGDFDMETQNMVLNTKKLLGQETDSRSQNIRPIYFFN